MSDAQSSPWLAQPGIALLALVFAAALFAASGQLAQRGGLLAAVGLTRVMGVTPARWETVWALGWLAACVATAMGMALGRGWRARHQGLQQLGRAG